MRPAGDNARITHPERVVFAGAAYTKGDVADYYRSVARWLLPELAGRPLSLLRCPDGSQGECFFQKHHADSLGEDVHATGLKQKSGHTEESRVWKGCGRTLKSSGTSVA